MALQAITIDDRLYDVEKAQRSFMNSLIFPNGCLPSVEVIARNVARNSDLRMVDLEDITPHYAETLRRWRANVEAHAPRLAEMGYDERFQRLWTLYLSFCEAGFTERRIGSVQVVLAKPRWRGHLATAEAPAAAVGRLGGGRMNRVAAPSRPARRLRRALTAAILAVVIAQTRRPGAAEPLVLLHALGTDRHMWDPVIERLRERSASDRARHAGVRRVARTLARRRARHARRPRRARSTRTSPRSASTARTSPATRSAAGWRSSSRSPAARAR